MYGSSAPIQFDASGAIYYSGYTIPTGGQSGHTVLRKFDGSTIRDLITGNVWVQSFAVAPNGTVVVTGQTTSTNTVWTRRISPSGSLATLENGSVNFTSVFPDGNVYMGTSSNSGSVERYLTASDQMDSRPWIADATSGANPYNDAHPVWCPDQQFSCIGGWNSINWSYSSPDGSEYVTTGSMDGSALAQYFPKVQLLPSQVKRIGVAAGVGNQIALAGTDTNSRNVLTLVNPADSSERQLIGPDNEIEIYHLEYVASSNEILFDGLRFSDNQYVVGAYNLSTNQYSVSISAGKLADLQGF
jgi:hypothetical protein